MTASSACVEFNAVSKRYGDTQVLRDINLQFSAGLTSAIVGASGSGKTTLLRLINALEHIDGGVLKVNGASVAHRSERGELTAFRRSMGYAVQGAGLFPHLSVMNNVTLVARLDGQAAADCEVRAGELLTQMNLATDLWARFPGQLSGGQQQRVGLCRALMLAPQLLLLDEPFSAVDPITRLELHELFLQLNSQSTTSTIMVTHDIREATKLADHLVILAAGEVMQSGPIDEVIVAPNSDYVARLLAEQLS